MLSVTPKSKKISNMIFLLYIQVGTSPSVMVFDDMEMNYDKRTEWVSPSFSNEVFERSGVEKVKKKTFLKRRNKQERIVLERSARLNLDPSKGD